MVSSIHIGSSRIYKRWAMTSAPRRVWCRVEPHPHPSSRSRQTWAFPDVKAGSIASRSDP